MTENKQVRVDNWGIFFLQRLQLFFSKTDYCDLTLQFQGNVQLKVHRLVLNACTEYFELLENSDRMIDDNVILMPEMLQADVVVPIINFMYTGMLEYTMGLYHKLYQAADLMHISVLTKLLDAQRKPTLKSKKIEKKTNYKIPKSAYEPNSWSPQTKRGSRNNSTELPSTLPGRKLPIWKRKTVTTHNTGVSSFGHPDPLFDPLSLADAAKPTRFEWPEDDIELPTLDMMDMSEFGDISYTSKPLLREDEVKTITHSHNEILKTGNVKEEVHELNLDDSDINAGSNRNTAEKRKAGIDLPINKSPKRIKIVEGEKDTTISVISSDNTENFDPTKIVSEILKKYPHLVKKKKNIKLKIISKPKSTETPATVNKDTAKKSLNQLEPPTVKSVLSTQETENAWLCKECTENSGKPMEFVLYYLYRKHMTDVHNMKFDPRICKYCGVAFAKADLHSFHLFTKHGIKPPGNQNFPSCPHCPYVALSKQALQIHKDKHKRTEVQCCECKLAFTSSDAISSHMQITGHSGKVKNRNIYDCQYCMKTSQSAISLLSHIKANHENEGRRDGIVSLDEIHLEENVKLEMLDHVEQGQSDGQYIVPEIGPLPKKVKIISDVTVPPSMKAGQQEILLNQAETHTTVPTSIATSLGLLDIVVLDENQQIILQNQEEQDGQSRTEYILPQIASRNVGDTTLTTSNDELVMVLTDQDYKDGHSAITSDNSNIVVLYSHPADGHQGQFITSQGNLMVNSETGLLEIRNGATIATTTASQIVVSDSHTNHMETIEMIQREINEGSIKQEQFYEVEQKTTLSEEPTDYEESSVEQRDTEPEEHLQHDTEAEEHLQHDTEPEEHLQHDTEPEDHLQHNTEPEEHLQCDTEPEENLHHDAETIREAEHDVSMEEEASEPAHRLDETQADVSSTCGSAEEMETEQPIHETSHENTENEQDAPEIQDGSLPMKSEKRSDDQTDASDVIIVNEKTETPPEVEINVSEKVEEHSTEIVEIEEAEKVVIREDNASNKMVIEDQQCSITPIIQKNETSDDLPQLNDDVQDSERPYSPTDNPIDIECDIESNPDINEKHDTESVNETEGSIEISQCDIELEARNKESASIEHETEAKDQENDENSQSAPGSPQVTITKEDMQDESIESPAKISILDDWEDTDSQQSEKKDKSTKKVAEEAVHKLMDDWEEEDVEK